MTRPAIRIAVLAALAGAAAPGPAQESQPPAELPSTQPEVTLVLEPGQRPALRLAFPGLSGLEALGAEAARAAREVEATLRADLEASGIFHLQGPAELAIAAEVGSEVERYRSLGNEAWLAGEVKQTPTTLVFEGRIFDLKSGEQILGKRYSGEFSLARRIAHSFADEVVLYFTGRPGIALTTVAFASDRDGDKELYLMDYDGWNPRRITAHRSTSMSPEWSPQGDGVAYVSFFGGSPGIYLVDLASGRKTPILADGTFASSPSFAPDGRRIALARSVDGNAEIFVCNRDGGGLVRLTHSAGIDTNPAWSPTGREIAFTSSRSGSPQIHLMDAEGTNVRRLTFEGDYNDGASWDPRGNRIAYAARRDSRFEIALTDLVTLETRLLTAGPGSSESPCFSPDGRKVAFTSRTPHGQQIFVTDVDGGRVVQLTRDGQNWSPAWSGFAK